MSHKSSPVLAASLIAAAIAIAAPASAQTAQRPVNETLVVAQLSARRAKPPTVFHALAGVFRKR